MRFEICTEKMIYKLCVCCVQDRDLHSPVICTFLATNEICTICLASANERIRNVEMNTYTRTHNNTSLCIGVTYVCVCVCRIFHNFAVNRNDMCQGYECISTSMSDRKRQAMHCLHTI